MLKLFLTIVAAVIVSIFLLILGLILALKVMQWRLKKSIGEIGEAFKGMAAAANAVPPARIRLKGTAAPQWTDKTTVDRSAGPLLGVGFQDIGTFTTDELPGITIRALMHPERSLYATVYETPQAGVFVDVVARAADGPSLTVTSTSEGEGLNRPAEHPIVRVPGATPEQLFERAVSEWASNPLYAGKMPRPVSAGDFPMFFEKAYAEIMDWKLARGFLTPDEIRAVAGRGGQHVDEAVLTMTALAITGQVRERLDEVIREKFVEQTNMPAAEWEKVRDRVVIVHDRIDLDEVPGLLAVDDDDDAQDDSDDAGGGGDDDQPLSAKLPPGMTPRRYFAEQNEKRPPDRRHTKLGEVSEPVPADVYARPERDGGDD